MSRDDHHDEKYAGKDKDFVVQESGGYLNSVRSCDFFQEISRIKGRGLKEAIQVSPATMYIFERTIIPVVAVAVAITSV